MNRLQFFHRLSQWAEQQPNADVLVSGEVQLRWVDLMENIQQRAEWLNQQGVQRLGLLADNSVNWVLWDLAALFSEITLVPMPMFFSPQQHQHLIKSAGIDCVLSDLSQEDVQTLLLSAVPDSSMTDSMNDRSEIKDSNDVELQRIWVHQNRLTTGIRGCMYSVSRIATNTNESPVLPEQTTKVTFTSGSTGLPKGVCLSAEQQLQVAESLVMATESLNMTKHNCLLPLATLLENIAGVYTPLLAGACIQINTMSEVGFKGATDIDLPTFIQGLLARSPESIVLIPQLLLALVSCIEMGAKKPKSLRFISVGGGRVSQSLLDRAHALGLPVYQGYGLSENASVSTLNTYDANKPDSVGKPLAHNYIRIAEDGEVLIKGNQMLGYLDSSEPKPSNQNTWLSTGDLGHLDKDGFLYIHGRKKNLFITSFGRNVNPEWVESDLTQQLPIKQAIVWGDAQPFNVAVIVPRNPCVSWEQIQDAIDHTNADLPEYARVTAWVMADDVFSISNGLATSNGRLKRQEILNQYQTKIHALYDEAVYGKTLRSYPQQSDSPHFDSKYLNLLDNNVNHTSHNLILENI